jgi:myosin heavy subunit
MMSNQQTEYSKTTEDFLKKMENEQIARKNLEALILKERKENERKIKEAEAQIDNITLNFQMAVAAKTSSETKLTTLAEQKKLLVKEVKQLRKKMEELTAGNEEMKSLNDRLLKAASALKSSVTLSVSSSPKTLPKEENTLVSSSSTSTIDEGVVGEGALETNEENSTVLPPSTTNTTSTNSELEDLLAFTDQLIAKSEAINPSSSSHHNSIDSRGRSFDTNSDDPSSSLTNRSPSSATNPLSRAMNLFRSTGGSGSGVGVEDSDHPRHGSDDKSGHYSRNNSIAGDEDHYEERPSWEMPAMALRELGEKSTTQLSSSCYIIPFFLYL